MKWPNAEVDWDPYHWIRQRKLERPVPKPTGSDVIDKFMDSFRAATKRKDTDD